jgi:hypothetical protein
MKFRNIDYSEKCVFNRIACLPKCVLNRGSTVDDGLVRKSMKFCLHTMIIDNSNVSNTGITKKTNQNFYFITSSSTVLHLKQWSKQGGTFAL